LTQAVGVHDTTGELLDRLARAGAELLLATLDGIASGALTARPQSNQGVSLAPKLTVEDARIDWRATAAVVDRRIRGCTPAPGAWSRLRDERIKLGPVNPDASAGLLAPGRIRAARREVHVGTGTVPVRLGWVQAPGKRMMPAADWARGLRLGDDEGFSS
ncbi:MAG: methionyl-tRNA formyltransferase, partial [Micrococcales bacterium]|nr:methionyl-tRNA formyltransferase [Micrococcales bacterium]